MKYLSPMMKLPPNRILISITEEDRDKIFKKIITSSAGQEFTLIKDIQAKENTDKFYSQTVNMGYVLEVGPECTQVQVDDIVLFDNLVDTNPAIVLEQTPFRKKIVLQESHTYHTDDYLVPPSAPGKSPKYVWRIGTEDEMSRILAIFRNGEMICPKTLLITDYHDDSKGIKKYPGLIYDEEVNKVATRVVKKSSVDSKLKTGEGVLVEKDKVMQYDFGPYKFDVFFEEDVLMKFSL